MAKKQAKVSSKKPRRNAPPPVLEVPPVIIKGGSIGVIFRERPFTIDEFDDPGTKTRVRRVSHPDNIRIFKVEIRDNRAGQRDKLLCSFELPNDNALNGQIDINIFAE